jgi:hypothetical protein
VTGGNPFSIALNGQSLPNDFTCNGNSAGAASLTLSNFTFTPSALTAYSSVDLSTPTPTAILSSGSSAITSFTPNNRGSAIYRSQYKTWALDNGNGLSFNLNMTHPRAPYG